ncbi:hypothetical protein DPMN_011842 [Dreissena polymorpha]|uniref:Uncharacterized protein n=1 Tax=Dreissena polymorpha TaxID=45954 RepID=A0A9D4S278_DREPO|nr:hypothetical protein DPMN_011842 [Dreissena polymorpha]
MSCLPGGHALQQTGTIFKVIKKIIRINVLAKFQKDWTINVISRENALSPDRKINVASRVRNAPPLGCNVFQPTRTIFELVQYIIGKIPNLRHVLYPTEPIFELIQEIIDTNILTKFQIHKDQTINVGLYNIWKNAPTTGSNVFQQPGTIFELPERVSRKGLGLGP